MDRNKIILCFTFVFSAALEWFIRKGAVILYGTNGFALWPWVDNVMHFAWGLNIFLILVVLFKWEPLDAVLGVFVWQMGWEASEVLGDIMISQPAFMFDHFFFDGVKDTAVDVLGALLAWRLFAWNGKDKHPRRFRGFMVKYVYASLLLVIIGTAYFVYTWISGLEFRSPNLFSVYWIAITAVLIAGYELLAYKKINL